MDELCIGYLKKGLQKIYTAFTRAVEGDFSTQLEASQEEKEFSEIYTGVNFLFHAVRQRIDEYKTLAVKLKDILDEVEQKNSDLEDAKKEMLGVLEDLGSEKEKLKEANVRNEAILASIGEGLVITDNTRKITMVNNIGADMIGWEKDEIRGMFWPEFVIEKNGKGDIVPYEKTTIYKSVVTGKVTQSQFQDNFFLTRKNKSIFPVIVTVAPIERESERLGFVITFRDISGEKAADMAKSDFISLASHQLKTPLTSIKWVLERLLKKQTSFSEDEKGYLQDIHISTQRLSGLVDLLLNASRVEGGRVSVTPQEVEAVGFIQSFLAESAADRCKAHESGVSDVSRQAAGCN